MTICNCPECSCYAVAEEGQQCLACRAGYHTDEE